MTKIAPNGPTAPSGGTDYILAPVGSTAPSGWTEERRSLSAAVVNIVANVDCA